MVREQGLPKCACQNGLSKLIVKQFGRAYCALLVDNDVKSNVYVDLGSPGL
jgi:hypothetical protein